MYEDYYFAHFPFLCICCHLHLHLWCKVQSSLLGWETWVSFRCAIRFVGGPNQHKSLNCQSDFSYLHSDFHIFPTIFSHIHNYICAIRFVGGQYKFPLIHTNIFPLIFSYVIFHYQLYHFLQIFTNVKMQKSVPLTLRWIVGWAVFLHLWPCCHKSLN